jgi:hypothetical protein
MPDDRYQREIDELLKGLERQHREPLSFRLRRRGSPWRSIWQRGYGVIGGHSAVERLMMLAVALLGLTLVLSFLAPWFTDLVATLALASFLAALVVSIGEGASGNHSTPHGHRAVHPQPGPAVDWSSLGRRLRRWWRRLRG